MPKPLCLIIFLFFFFFAKSQTASFTYQSSDGLYCSPVNVQFVQTTTGNARGFIWNFGNGQSSSSANPATVYTTAGTYTVTLTAVYNNSTVQTSQTLVINSGITASLTANRNYICTPGAIIFTASNSGNITNYEWDFGDGSPLSNTTTATISHNFSVIGSYLVKVKVTDVSGCTATSTYAVVYQNPPVTATLTPAEGCIPALVSFSATPNIPAGTTVTNYTWNFGDGSSALSTTSSSVSHSYTVVGSYSPTVSLTTSEGCSNNYSFASVAYGTPPTALSARSDKAVYCGSETPTFYANATNANKYIWDFGDGTSATVFDTITTHKYDSLGVKSITVTPYFNGCAGASTSFQVDIVGVIASFNFNNTCSTKSSFSFTNTSQGIINSYLWNFGDGSPVETIPNPSHTYGSGSFSVSLIVTDSMTGCSSRASASVHSGSSTLTNPDTAICRNSITTSTVNNNQNNAGATYLWNVVGRNFGPSADDVLNINASTLGNFTNNYVVINNGTNYCPDTVYLNRNILVRGPNLSFDAPASVCQNSIYSINNTSSAFVPTDSVVLWYWNYGITNRNDTIIQPAPMRFTGPGLFNLKLVARDNKGCVDSLSKQVRVNPIPFVEILPKSNFICAGSQDTLLAYHSDTLLWTSSGALACNNCDTLIISPTTTTQYVATATNSFNCSISDTAIITVYSLFTAQPTASPVSICAGESITINAGPPGKIISWSPSQGLSSASIYNPVASPLSGTTYTATLTDSARCFSSTTSVYVNVKSLPTVDAGADRIVPYNTPFTITPMYSNNVRSYLWSPANLLSCRSCATPSGTALGAQTYIIQVRSDSGCVARDSVRILVECKFANLLIPSAFTPNRDANNDLYYPLARGISIIKRFSIFNRYGQLIFEVKNFKPNDKAFGWDGKFKGQDQSPATYVYFLEAVCDAGGTILKKDSFILLR